MKKLLKSQIYGFMNSARCVLIGWEEGEKSNFAVTVYAQCMNSSHKPTNVCKNKIKKEKKKKTPKTKHWFLPNPNIALVPFWYSNKMLKIKMIYLKGNKPFWNIGQKLRKKNNDYAKKR